MRADLVAPSPLRPLQALSCLSIAKLRFYAKSSCTSLASSTIHFTTSDAGLIQYVRTGDISAQPGLGIQPNPGYGDPNVKFRTNWTTGWYTLQPDHTATQVPQLVDSGWVNLGNLALPHSPFL